MMKSKALVVAAALLGLTLGACGSGRATRSAGTLQTTVRLDDPTSTTANQVVQVTVSIKSSDPAAPAIAPVVLTPGADHTYVGTFSQLPVSTHGGPTYDLIAEGADATGAVLFRGSATQVAVTEQPTATVLIIASSTAPAPHTDYVPVRITAVQAGHEVRSGEKLTFAVTVNPDATGEVVIGWTQSGVSDPSTVFNPPDQASTVWTAPATATFRTEHITVSASNGAGTPSTVTFDVNVAAFVRLTVTPTTPDTLLNVAGVDGDGAPGMGSGCIKATGTPKAELYFTPAGLFGRAVTLGDVARMSYWTKKATTHVADVHDWFLAIYTAPYAGQTAGWYGARIGAEPYLAANLAETANAWNEWSTDGAVDTLRFFESTNGYFGSYTDPGWSEFVKGESLTGAHTSTPVAYAAQQVLSFSVQTASSAAGFDGELDGVRIELKDGSVAVIDLQPAPTAPAFSTFPAVLPPNLPSQPFQAQQTAEFGDSITLAPGTGRHAAQARVVMVTWATEAYSHPITLNLYGSTNGVLTRLGTRTQTFDIPARPPGDSTCPDTGYGAGFAWKAADGKCYNGLAFPITFDLTDASVVLPESFAYGIAYDTGTWGAAPLGKTGPYDSLNVGLIGDGSTASSAQPSVGADPDPDTCLRNFWDYAAATPGYTGLVPEAGWTGYAPAVEFFTY